MTRTPKSEEPLAARDLSRKAHFRLVREQYHDATSLFARAAERAEMEGDAAFAWSCRARQALSLSRAGDHAAARPIWEAALDARIEVEWAEVEWAFFHLLLHRAQERDAAGFRDLFARARRWGEERGMPFPKIHPHQEQLIDECATLDLDDELAYVIAVVRRWRKPPRALERRMRELEQARRLVVLHLPSPRNEPSSRRVHRVALTRGVLFALTECEDADLRSARGDPARRAVAHSIEERWDRAWLCETDKAWAYLQCLNDESKAGDGAPLFFGAPLHRGRSCLLELIECAHLDARAAALARLDEKAVERLLRACDLSILHARFGTKVPPSVELVPYLVRHATNAAELFARAYAAHRAVLFSAAT